MTEASEATPLERVVREGLKLKLLCSLRSELSGLCPL